MARVSVKGLASHNLGISKLWFSSRARAPLPGPWAVGRTPFLLALSVWSFPPSSWLWWVRSSYRLTFHAFIFGFSGLVWLCWTHLNKPGKPPYFKVSWLVTLSTSKESLLHEKMLNVTNSQRNANPNYKEVLPYISQNGHRQKSSNNKCWRGCVGEGPFLHCWWECQLV